ncbi:hypothetical protein [Neolewinella maritima]|uniref:hypothetical protein n=1 Tax=Neolewinella maritima TaxID=1383882 RepID=UPI001EE92471|nr:hypothetical protein [Neolewinella maritima]
MKLSRIKPDTVTTSPPLDAAGVLLNKVLFDIEKAKANALRDAIDKLEIPFTEAVKRVTVRKFTGRSYQEFVLDDGLDTEMIIMKFNISSQPGQVGKIVIESI